MNLNSIHSGAVFPVVIKTLHNLEDELAAELDQLGAHNIHKHQRAVNCTCDIRGLYRFNYGLRTALRILMPLYEFEFRNADDFYRKAKKLPWNDWLDNASTFAIDTNVKSEIFRHSHFAALRLKDAIADFFKDATGQRPDVDRDRPDFRLHLFVQEGKAAILLDSSGESLNRRGYRGSGAKAPLNEVLAAGMILKSGWNGSHDLCIPFCGSGTLLIEAISIAKKTSPHTSKRTFAFQHWPGFQNKIWEEVVNEFQSSENITCAINGSDIHPKAVSSAAENLRNAGCINDVSLEQKDFFKLTPEKAETVLILNPPYGERMEEDDAVKLYGEIGTQLKHHWEGCTAWIIGSDPDAMKNIGLKASKKIELMNGPLVCRYMKFELFRGKRHEQKS
jgi:putative N6-adenine-specific DNA methylase